MYASCERRKAMRNDFCWPCNELLDRMFTQVKRQIILVNATCCAAQAAVIVLRFVPLLVHFLPLWQLQLSSAR